MAAIEAAEREKEEVEEKKRREAEGIFDDEVEAVNPNLNPNPEISGGYPEHDGFYDDGHQGQQQQQQQQQQRDRIDRPPMRFDAFLKDVSF